MGPIPDCRGLNCVSFINALFTPLTFGGAHPPSESLKFSLKCAVHGIDELSLSAEWILNLFEFFERQFESPWSDEGRFFNFIIVISPLMPETLKFHRK